MAGLAAYPEPYRVVALVYACDGAFVDPDEYTNTSDFLKARDGAWVTATIAAFRAIGRQPEADQLARAVAVMPKPYPETREARAKIIDADHGALASRLGAVEGPLGYRDDQEALAAYAKRQDILPR